MQHFWEQSTSQQSTFKHLAHLLFLHKYSKKEEFKIMKETLVKISLKKNYFSKNASISDDFPEQLSNDVLQILIA